MNHIHYYIYATIICYHYKLTGFCCRDPFGGCKLWLGWLFSGGEWAQKQRPTTPKQPQTTSKFLGGGGVGRLKGAHKDPTRTSKGPAGPRAPAAGLRATRYIRLLDKKRLLDKPGD